jgi:hypothetical protein
MNTKKGRNSKQTSEYDTNITIAIREIFATLAAIVTIPVAPNR